MTAFEIVGLGEQAVDYLAAWEHQREVHARVVDGAPDTVLLLEHPPTFTAGKRTDAHERPADPGGAPVIDVDRGGKITFHGPGQVVAYPIVRLEEEARDLHGFLAALEDALMRTVGDFGLEGHRDSRNTGCWVGGRKIASVGVAVRKWVTYHGLALNISTDLSEFRRFDPCGLDPEVMTSMEKELGGAPAMDEVKASLTTRLRETLGEDRS